MTNNKTCRTFFCVFILILSALWILACGERRTSAETKALLIGKWETVTDNDFELPYVITDSIIECAEFVPCGEYMISDKDSITIYGVDTTKARITFPEGERTLMLTFRDYHLRLKRMD